MNWRGRTWNIVAAAPESERFADPRNGPRFFGFDWFLDGRLPYADGWLLRAMTFGQG